MSTLTSNTYALAGSAILVAAASYAALKARESPSSTALSTIKDIDDIDESMDDDVEYITEEIVVKIFDRLFMEMQNVLVQLSQQIQQLQMSGQMIPEKQVRQVIKNEYERALTLRQYQIFDEYDVDEDCLEEATWEFLNNEDKYPNVKKSVERFQRLYENVSGESIVGKRPGQLNNDSEESQELLGKEKTVEAAEVYFNALTQNMAELIGKYKSEGKDINSPAIAQQLQMEFSSSANDAGEAALKGQDITLKTFQRSIEAHSSDPSVGRALAMLQMKQQQTLMSMGLQP